MTLSWPRSLCSLCLPPASWKVGWCQLPLSDFLRLRDYLTAILEYSRDSFQGRTDAPDICYRLVHPEKIQKLYWSTGFDVFILFILKKIQLKWSAMYCMFMSDWRYQMYSNKDEVRQSSKCSFTIIKNLEINLCHREESSTSEQRIWSSLPKGSHHWSKERPFCKIKKSRLMKDYFWQFSSNLMLWSYSLYLQSVSNLLWLERDRSEKWQQI